MTTYDVPNSPLNFTNVTDRADTPITVSCKNQATNTVILEVQKEIFRLKKFKMESEICG